MKKLLFVTMLGLFAAFSSCEKSDEVDFLFKETQCSNPWQVDFTEDYEYFDYISAYLTDCLSVEISDFRYTSDGIEEMCQACPCLTGNNIRFSADEEFTDVLVENGFEIDE